MPSSASPGPRVIEETIRERLPEGFQRAEYLRDHGMVDMVVHRRELRQTLSLLLSLLRDKTPPAEVIALHGKDARRGRAHERGRTRRRQVTGRFAAPQLSSGWVT